MRLKRYPTLDVFLGSQLYLETIRPREQGIHPTEMDGLIDELYDIALDAFDKHLPYEAIDDRTRESACIMVLRDTDQKAIGYAVNDELRLSGIPVNYFSTALIRREWQNKGIYKWLNNLRIATVPADVVMTRTQNPIVYRGFNKLCGKHNYKLYPNGNPNPQAVSLAKAFCPETDNHFIVPGVYFGRSLMDDTPKPKGGLEKDIWQHLDVEAGDAVILVGLRNI